MATFNPGSEIVIADNKIYRLNPTNIGETDKGAYGIGGTAELLGNFTDASSFYSNYKIPVNQVKTLSSSDISSYQANATPSDSVIQQKIQNIFSSTDPNKMTGDYSSYLSSNMANLVSKAKEYGAGDIATYGKLWNEYRNQPTVDKTYQDYRTNEAKKAEELATQARQSTWINPTTGQASPAGTGLPSAVNGIYIENEADLQSKRDELAKAGVPMSEWSKYITNVGGKLYYGQPATLTSPTGERKVVASGSSEASQLLDSGWTLGNKVGGGTIDTKLLTPEEPLNISTGGTSNLYNSDTATASATATSKSTDELIKYYQDLLTPKESDLSKQVSELLGDVSEGADSLTGRGAAQLAEEQKRGIEAKNAALASANTQLKTKLAEIDALTASYNQANQSEEGRPQTLSRLQGAQAQNYKMYLAQKNGLAAEAGILQANILGLQGELTSAQAAADRAVDLAYADKEAAYNAKLAQLQILQPQLEKEEKTYATALQLALQQQSDALAEKKANQKLLMSSNLDLMTKYPDAGITISDTPEVIQQKVSRSAIYKEQVRPPQYASGGSGSSGGGGSTKNYSASNIPSTIKTDLIEDISTGANADQIYAAYPEVNTDYIDALMENLPSETGDGSTISTAKKEFKWWNPTTWF